VERGQLHPGRCGSVRFRVHLRPSGPARRLLPGGGGHCADCRAGTLEAHVRLRPSLRKTTSQGRGFRGKRQAAGEASGRLSSGPDLLSVELCTRGRHAAAVLSDQYAARIGFRLRLLQRNLCRRVHPDISAVRLPVQDSFAEQAAVVGNAHRRAADDSAGIHSLRQSRAGLGGTDRADGGDRHGGVLRPRDAILSARLARNLDDAGRRRSRALGACRRSIGLMDLQQQPSARIHILRDRDDRGVRTDPALDPDDAEDIDCHQGWRAQPGGRGRGAEQGPGT